MKVVVMAVKDIRLGEFLPPYCAPNIAVGERMFMDAVSDGNSPFAKNPDDYVLHILCEFETELGQFDNSELFAVMSSARKFVKEF